MKRAKYFEIKEKKKKCINILDCIVFASSVLLGITIIVMLIIHYFNT